MEDSVGEIERREQGEIMKKARHDEQVEAGRGVGGGEEGGFLSAMASKIGAAMGSGDVNGGDTVNVTAASGGEEEKKEDGHGGGGIFQKFMSSSHTPSPELGAPETEEVKGEENAQGAGGEQHGGILSSMASRIGMAMSGANGNGDHHTAAEDANGDAVDHVKGDEKEKGDDEANGGGILSAMASKIGMAMSSANGNGEHSTVGDGKTSNGDSAAVSKVEEGEANGGGLVDQIMSNLPSRGSAKEDQAPEADEASLLIAIIED